MYGMQAPRAATRLAIRAWTETVSVATLAPMATIRAVRRENLDRLIERAGGIPELATKAGVSEKYLRQIRNGFQGPKDRKPRDIGDTLARKLEDAFSLPSGWMDERHPEPPPVLANSFVTIPRQAHGASLGELHTSALLLTLAEIPVRGKAVLGGGGFVVLEKESEAGYVRFPINPAHQSAYAVRQDGDGLDPYARHGDFLVVVPEQQPSPGDDVLVRRNDGTVMVARLRYVRDGRLYLDAIVPNADAPAALNNDEIASVEYVAGKVSSRYHFTRG